MAAHTIGAGEHLLAMKRIGIGEIATRINAERGDVPRPIGQIAVGKFNRSAGGITVKGRKNRGGHSHVSVEGGGNLMPDPGLAALVGKATETRLAGFRISHHSYTHGK